MAYHIIYHIISYHIISWHILSYHISFLTVLYSAPSTQTHIRATPTLPSFFKIQIWKFYQKCDPDFSWNKTHATWRPSVFSVRYRLKSKKQLGIEHGRFQKCTVRAADRVISWIDKCSPSMGPAYNNITCEIICGEGKGISGHPMKAYGEGGGIAPLGLNCGISCRWVGKFTSRPLFSCWKNPPLGLTQSRSGRLGEKKNIFILQEFGPRTVQPVV